MSERKELFSFNYLALLAVILMALSMLMPWWSFQLEGSPQTDIYPYLIDGPGSEFIGYKRSPQMEILTGLLIGCISFALAASILDGLASKILLGISGLFTLLGTWRLIARVAGVAARFDVPLQGQGIASESGFAQIPIWTQLRMGTYLIIAGAVLAILAAILHSRTRIIVWK
ncbi:MAG: hypothetical protein U5K99_04120 [Anaerolineales bacterium]|nr:hypothetical protein [Anaerolineales bacterium]